MRYLYILLTFLVFSCGNDQSSTTIPDNCKTLVISEQKFMDKDTYSVKPTEVEIEGDCMKVSLGIGGCDADHDVDMVTDGAIAESLPVQISFLFEDLDPQPCNAYFLVEYEFDLTLIGTLTDDAVKINFVGSELSILYDN